MLEKVKDLNLTKREKVIIGIGVGAAIITGCVAFRKGSNLKAYLHDADEFYRLSLQLTSDPIQPWIVTNVTNKSFSLVPYIHQCMCK